MMNSAPSQASHRLYTRQEAASSSTPRRAPDAPLSAADVVHVKGIDICGWTVETSRGSIADSKTIDELSDRLKIPLPEMPFDKNALRITHEASGWQYIFDAVSALRSVEGVDQAHRTAGLDVSDGSVGTSNGSAGTGGAGSKRAQRSGGLLGDKPKKSRRVKVAYADEWGKSREPGPGSGPAPVPLNTASNFGSDVAKAVASAANDPTSTISLARDYDWTYSCTWPGHELPSKPSAEHGHDGEGVSESQFHLGTDPARDRIPIERLGPPPNAGMPGAPKPEPILFYDDLVLYEDELGDNGSSMLNVKVRVMPSGFLVLQRFFLRVDDVLFRIFDTRMYVGFDEDEEPMDLSRSHAASSTAAAPPVTMVPTTARPRAPISADTATRQMGALSLGPTRRQMMGAPSAGAQPMCPSKKQKARDSQFHVIRECSGCQASYAEVKSRLPPYKSNDLSPLTDPGWVAQNLEKIAQRRAQELLRRQGQRGISDPAAVLAMAKRPGQTEYRGPGTAPVGHQLSPATLPGAEVAATPNRILAEVRQDGKADDDDDDDRWEGEGARVDVAVLGGRP